MMKYRAFIKVVETGNITKAAKELGYSQPGISHMINALETEVGFPLLNRSKDSITPTEDGKKILTCCNQIVKDENTLREVADSIKGLISGTLKIGALNSMLVNFIPRIVSKFSAKYPNIEIILQEYSTSDLINALKDGIIDLAFMANNAPKGFEFSPIFDDTICLAVHKSHPFTYYDKLPVSYLNGCDFIMPEAGWDDLVLMVQNAYPFFPTIRHYTASDTAAFSMVAENLGVYVLSSLQVALLPENVVIKEFKEPISRSLGICTKSFKSVTPALKEFIAITNTML